MTTTDGEEDIPSIARDACKRNRHQTQHPDFFTFSDGTIFYINSYYICGFGNLVSHRYCLLLFYIVMQK